jgi:D-alanine--poly(phosphoribitol) ligase subunit 1
MTADVVDLFLACASRSPDHPAVVASSGLATYRDLERRVRAFAARFAERPEPRVLVALPPSVDAYACILAAGLAGGFHTPLNMASPPEKMRRIARQLRPDFIVAEPALLGALAEAAEGADGFSPRQLDTDRQLPGSGRRHALAYVFFTSGSTGDPKGVMVSRSALGHYVDWLKSFDISPGDRLSQQPSIAFDISMTDIFGALCHGATLYPLDIEGDRLMPARFIQRNRITIWNSTPSAIGLMMQARQVTASNLSSVRLFNFCGEPLLREHLDSLFAAVPGAEIQNTYGPTEATVSVTALRLRAGSYSGHCRASVALGEPVDGMRIVLANGPSPDEGEIVILGPQLAEGYWNDPERTAAAIRPVPEAENRRGYFTGDWARRIDGELYFKERIDFQVKVRGHRVELDEVAAAIGACGHPVACVFKRGEALAAVVEGESGGGGRPGAALRSALGAKLEPHAVPERILFVRRIPRNENDKLDRNRAAALLDDHAREKNGQARSG